MKELIKTPSVQKGAVQNILAASIIFKDNKKICAKYKFEHRKSDKIVYKEYNQGQQWLIPQSLDELISQEHYGENKFKQKTGNTR